MDGGLPYDGTPPPEDSVAPGPPRAEDLLDRPLEDYRAAPPAHVAQLMGRMSRGKVYMLDETPAIIHVDDGRRVRGDAVSIYPSRPCQSYVRPLRLQRIARLAEQLDQHDPTTWLSAPLPVRSLSCSFAAAVSEASNSTIRPSALFVSSELIKHLSTSRVFSWTTSLGASIMGSSLQALLQDTKLTCRHRMAQ